MKRPWLLFAVGCVALETARIWGDKATAVAVGDDQPIEACWPRGVVAGGHVDFVRPLSVFASGQLEYTAGTYQATNAGVTVDGRILPVFKKINDEWLIAAHGTEVRDQP